jgi:hypothetical protein
MTYLDEAVERLMWARLGLREDQARDVIAKLEPAVEARIEKARGEERAKLEARLLSDEAKRAAHDVLCERVPFDIRGDYNGEALELGEAVIRAALEILASHPTPDGEQRAAEDGVPPELLKALRDPHVTIGADAEYRLANGQTLAEHLEEWRNAPSNTVSAVPTTDGPASPSKLIDGIEAAANDHYHGGEDERAEHISDAIDDARAAMASHPTPDGEQRCGGNGLISITGEAVLGHGTIGVPESAPCPGCPDCTPDGPASPVLGDEEREPKLSTQCERKHHVLCEGNAGLNRRCSCDCHGKLAQGEER